MGEAEDVPELPRGDDFTRANLMLLRNRLVKLRAAIQAERFAISGLVFEPRNLPRRVSTTRQKRLRDQRSSDRGRPPHMRSNRVNSKRYAELGDKLYRIDDMIVDIDQRLPNLPKEKRIPAKRVPPPEVDEFL